MRTLLALRAAATHELKWEGSMSRSGDYPDMVLPAHFPSGVNMMRSTMDGDRLAVHLLTTRGVVSVFQRYSDKQKVAICDERQRPCWVLTGELKPEAAAAWIKLAARPHGQVFMGNELDKGEPGLYLQLLVCE